MSVNPGLGGQDYLPRSTNKILELKTRLNELCLDRVIIEVDGGVKLNTARKIVTAGGDVLVAGSAIFGTQDPTQTIKDFYAI